jgi:hypothetical protein
VPFILHHFVSFLPDFGHAFVRSIVSSLLALRSATNLLSFSTYNVANRDAD